MRTWCMVVALAALPAGAVAQQEPGKGPEAKVSFEKRAFPFEGEVAVERLNVRMFPKSDQQSIITTVLSQGEKVVVVGEKDDFFQILPPKGSTAWIFGRNVKKEAAGAVTTAADVPVRLDSRVNADVVASLKEGEPVKIVAEHMGWFKIEAPAAVKYYVGKKYVKAGAAVELVAKPVPDEKKPVAAPADDGDAKARATLQVADQLLDEQTRLVNEKKLESVDFSRVVAAYESARDQARSAAVKSEAERGLNRIQQLHLIWEGVRAQIVAQKQKLEAELAKVNEPKPEPAKGPLMTGYVDTTGLLWKRPGTHKLIMGGKIVCFLRSKEGDEKMVSRLNDFYQKYVGINGTLIKNPEGWDGYSVIVVDEIVPIEK